MYCHISIGNLICFLCFLSRGYPSMQGPNSSHVSKTGPEIYNYLLHVAWCAPEFILPPVPLPYLREVWKKMLTHWGRVTHICVSKLTIIGSDNGLSPGRRQAIFRTNAGILLIGLSATNFSEILIGIQTFSFKKIHLKMSSAKWRPFCLGLIVLK